MTNIEPNNNILPDYWLVNAVHENSFMARTTVDVYSVIHEDLGRLIDKMTLMDDTFFQSWKTEARLIARREFDDSVLYTKWIGLLEKVQL